MLLISPDECERNTTVRISKDNGQMKARHYIETHMACIFNQKVKPRK